MRILCIETSTSVCSAAVCEDGQVVAQRICREGANHARLLPCFLDDLVQSLGLSRNSLDAVSLSSGPGSYTGLRIGTSTAKGLCYGWRVPLVPVPTLEVLCAAAKKSTGDRIQNTEYRIQSTDVLCPMIDARRMEVYTALYDSQIQPITEVRAMVMNEDNSLSSEVEGKRIWYFGDGAAKCQEILSGEQWQYIPDIVPEAQYMGALAEQLLKAGKGLSGNETAYYEPFYLKEFVAAQSHVKGLV